MVAHTLEQLTAAGMAPEDIKYENFYYAAAGEPGGLTADAALTRLGDNS
jgi:hypothetical protein